eukprot:5074287-Lingulodinium_polyedra.AAC.1
MSWPPSSYNADETSSVENGRQPTSRNARANRRDHSCGASANPKTPVRHRQTGPDPRGRGVEATRRRQQ